MSATLCENCRAWVHIKERSKPQTRWGLCHRHPPLADGRDPADFPLTSDNSWCLDFVARDASK